MATEHGGNTTVPGGIGLLQGVVASVLRRFGDPSNDRTATDRQATGTIDADTSEPEVDGPGDRLLTPEEHILGAIERSGGAMKQSEIVAAVEWSESTVSRKLTELESREAVSRYQIGREKLVYLPGHEPEAARSALATAGAD